MKRHSSEFDKRKLAVGTKKCLLTHTRCRKTYFAPVGHVIYYTPLMYQLSLFECSKWKEQQAVGKKVKSEVCRIEIQNLVTTSFMRKRLLESKALPSCHITSRTFDYLEILPFPGCTKLRKIAGLLISTCSFHF